jgi:DNA invertase Pin-like site-specific DNA recombinase
MSRLRCAIYTRKSSEEGLDQAFNSLDAQRTACEAYIASQAGEGWLALATPYDDGGYSGATMQRPGLQALLGDIAAGKVKVVVVYKVDRLTRSLADFARLVDLFDRHGVSFVSVTQQFNTTTSMGRLTLNVLLSFAQFEREVTAERIRDKIAASKKKGLWMGGVVPLGYDVKERKLVINAAEAETLREIFRLYLEHGNVRRVQEEAKHLGLKTKARRPNNGKRPGGAEFTRGHLYKLLSNPIYIGEILHKKQRYPGEHPPLIDAGTWRAVQDQLNRNAANRRHRTNAKSPSLLAGLLTDGEGRPMKPSHACKAERRYRYYISRLPENATPNTASTWRLPAPALEAAVIEGIAAFLGDALRLTDALDLSGLPAGQLTTALAESARLGADLRAADPGEQRRCLLELVKGIEVRRDSICIILCGTALRARIGGSDRTGRPATQDIRLELPQRVKRCGLGQKLVIDGGHTASSDPDPALIAAIARARRCFEALRSGAATSVGDLAAQEGIDRGEISRLLPLAFFAPDLVTAMLDGRQPATLTAARLTRLGELPADWSEQRRILGPK